MKALPAMAVLAIFLSSLCAQQGAPGQTATGSVEGKLTDAATGLPVAGMTVNAQGPGKRAPARSAANGNYRISDLSSGEYRIVVPPGNGYTFATRYVRIQGGESLKGIDMKLPREAVIAGRVLDRDKNPVPGARVTVRSQGYLHGRPAPYSSNHGVANDLGEYRITGMAPGSYYLEVDRKRIEIHKAKPAGAREKAAVMTNIKTYYPNGVSVDEASPITVRAGEVRDVLDITLLNERTTCLTSAVADAASSEGQMPVVTLSEPYPGSQSVVASGRVRPGDEFEACGIGPGSYRLSATVFPPEGDDEGLRYASEVFTAGEHSVTLPPLNLQPSFPLSGRIAVADAKPDDPPPVGLLLTLDPKDRIRNLGEKTSAITETNGTFTFPALIPGPYWLDVHRIPPGYYLKEARLGMSDVVNAPLFAAPGARLEIVLGSDGPSISGRVSGHDNEPVADATVILAANPPLSIHTDQNGKFLLKGMAPGDYRIEAFAGLPDEMDEDPSFIQANFARATELTVGPGESKMVNLTSQPVN